MAIILDASFIVALDNVLDVHHINAGRISERIQNGEFGQMLLPDCVFDEIIAVCLRKKGKERARTLGKVLLDAIPIAYTDENLFNKAWELFEKEDHTLSFTDCTIISLAERINAHIVTFDREFKKMNMNIVD